MSSNSSFYVDGNNTTTGVVTSNDVVPPTGNGNAPSSFYQGGAGNQYATLQNADTLTAEFDADLAAAQAQANASASSASSSAASASSAAAALATFLASGATATPLMDGVAAVGTSNLWVRQDHVHPTDTTRAPLASPALTGTPTAPTPAVFDNSAKLATTAYVDAKDATAIPLVASGTGAVGTAHLHARQDHVHPADTATADARIANAAGTVSPAMDGSVAAVGTSTKWAHEDHVHPTDTTRAPLASPTFTGTPTAPTPTVGDNSAKIATTAFVLANATNVPPATATPIVDGTGAVGVATKYAREDHVHPTDTSRAPLASPTFTGTPAAPTASAGTNTTQIATTAFVTAAVTGAGVSSVNGQTGALKLAETPNGRLTLQTLVPVMTTTQSAKTTLFYTPYNGYQIPIYDGTNMVPTIFSELSALTTDTTKSPAAIGAGKVNDWFVWNDAGTIRLSHGPDWTSDTARSAGTALVMVNGVLLNSVAITNGPAASRGTYVGTTRSNASSQLDWILGAASSGGTAGFLGVWNAYNRVGVSTTVTDNGASYTYTSSTVRQARASAGNQVTFVAGLSEDAFIAQASSEIFTVATTASFGTAGIGLDNTAAFSTLRYIAYTPAAAQFVCSTAPFLSQIPAIGAHVISRLEGSDGTHANTFDTNTGDTLTLHFRM